MASFARQLPAFRPALSRPRRLAFLSKHTLSFHNASTVTTLSWRTSCYPGSLLSVAGGVGLGMAISAFANPIFCQGTEEGSTTPGRTGPPSDIRRNLSDSYPPPPPSSVNLYELSFGTCSGICAGVFLKKGVKAVAFFVGGMFVLLQYFNSLSLIRVDWSRMSLKFENLFYTTEANGIRRPPTVVSLWRWFLDFLTADFQPRASFLAGLALGIRIG